MSTPSPLVSSFRSIEHFPVVRNDASRGERLFARDLTLYNSRMLQQVPNFDQVPGDDTEQRCTQILKNGKRCRLRAKFDQWCHHHAPIGTITQSIFTSNTNSNIQLPLAPSTTPNVVILDS